MVAYNFQSQFADAVISGRKKCTIRQAGKRRHARVGDTLQLYTGMRSKSCKLLKTETCSQCNKIYIFSREREVWVSVTHESGDYVRALKPDELEQLAINDGFADINAFFAFFDSDMLHGYLISWAK